MEKVRWGFIGTGARGTGHLNTLLEIDKAEVTAICAHHQDDLDRSRKSIEEKQKGVEVSYYGGDGDDNAWRKLLENDNVDAVVISTPWELHAPQAIAAMEAGKHAFIEVPAAITVDECWGLVETSERTGKHCMMLENCNYGREELALLNMVRQGLFGELLHGEAAYIHELRDQMLEVDYRTGTWRTWHYANNQGNLYPTHGLGPVAHYMDVGRGDWADYIVSVSTPALGRALYAKEHFPPEHKWNQIKKWNCGDLNTSLIKLTSGKTIMVQWDETSPRPYSRHNYIQGTRGAFGGFPNRISVDYKIEDLPEKVRATVPQNDKGRFDTHQWDTNLEPWLEVYDHPLWKKVGKIAEEHGGHGGMDYIMFWRLQQCLLRGEPMDQTVYDAALWSSVMPLSRASVENGSQPQAFPDFTRGKWKITPPLAIVEG
jgi:hypothetical protein